MFSNCTIGLCAFCYKSTTSPQTTQTRRVKYSVEFFYRLLGRFVRLKGGDCDLKFIGKLNSCQDCDGLIRHFCKVYHKIKCLELQLLWKLENLGNVMKLADRVPSRVKTVRQCFGKMAEDNSVRDQEVEQICQDGLKKMKSFRTDIIYKCSRGRLLSGLQPRVLLDRINDDNETSKPSSGDSKSNEIPIVIPTVTKVSQRWLLSVAAVAYLVMSSPLFEHCDGGLSYNEPLHDLTIYDDDNDDIGDPVGLSNESRNRSSNNGSAPIENCCLFGEDDTVTLKYENLREKTLVPVEIKHSPICNHTSITTQAKPAEFETTENINNKISKRNNKVKVQKSTQQCRFHCALCKTSYRSYGGLRKHKNNAFHRFLIKKTLKIVVNLGGKMKKRQTREKLYFAPKEDDGNHSNSDFSINEAGSSSNSPIASSSETSDTDHDNADIKPKIAKPSIPNKCTKCGQCFAKQGHLLRHLRNVHDTKNVKVRLNENKRKPVGYERHQLPLTKVHKFICSICGLEVCSGQELANHEVNYEKNSEKYVTCPRCKKYMPRVKYTGHFMINHLGANQKHKKFKCEICESQVTRLDQHFKKFHQTKDDSTKIYNCRENQCKAYFIQAIQLICHKRRVHNYNPLKCKYCGIALKWRGGMWEHIRLVHPDKKEDLELPMACDKDHCKRRFGTEEELEWHLKFDKHNSESDEQLCKKCGKEFPIKRLFNNHMRSECADPRSFICQICGKGFKTRIYLESHLQFHKGPDGYEYQCQTCGKKFRNKFMLKDHMTSHTRERRAGFVNGAERSMGIKGAGRSMC